MGSLKCSEDRELEVTERTENQSQRLESYHHRAWESKAWGKCPETAEGQREGGQEQSVCLAAEVSVLV